MRQLLLIVTLCLTSALAAQPAERGAGPEAGDAAARFAEKHGVPREELDRLRREEGATWDDICHALAVSRRTERPLAEVLAHRRSGESWRDVSKRYRLDHADVRREARRMQREAREAGLHDRRREERHERGGSGEEEERRRSRDTMRDRDRTMDGRGQQERSGERRDAPSR